ncbi:hypothetical protein B0T14DRAFT_139864 [Immersiella caudata]|uniref:Uncharacterized protein n=1 Tax=Immersiella caudata TaxID=314043 RepID=A0AA39X5C5_9PEZI|nr:hypothetical protein B0T14DRAFT_139864 [Immersiella caudata]
MSGGKHTANRSGQTCSPLPAPAPVACLELLSPSLGSVSRHSSDRAHVDPGFLLLRNGSWSSGDKRRFRPAVEPAQGSGTQQPPWLAPADGVPSGQLVRPKSRGNPHAPRMSRFGGSSPAPMCCQVFLASP